MCEEDFKRLFQELIESEILDPETAEKIFQRILELLFLLTEKPDINNG